MKESIENKVCGDSSRMKPVRLFRYLQEELESADAYLVVFSVVDKVSYTKAEQILITLHDSGMLGTRPAVLVANKIDLARSRAISSQGKCKAKNN